MSIYIAHRGLSAVAPENTMAAFDLAWAHDCDGIELDVQVSRDGLVVVHHDADLQRTAGMNIAIPDANYSELYGHDVGRHFGGQFAVQHMPLLNDVLTMMPAGKVIQVEVKPDVRRLDDVMECLRKVRRDVTVYVMSFNPEQLAELRAGLPHLSTLWIIDKEDAREAEAVCERARKAGFSGIDVHHEVIDADYSACVRENDLLLGCWTVNDLARMQALSGWGVDMIASDCAHLAKETS